MPVNLVIPNGPEIRRLRHVQAKTQDELAKHASCSKRTIERAENSNPINPKKLASIAKILGTEPKDLLKVVEVNPRQISTSSNCEPDAVLKFFASMDAGSIAARELLISFRKSFEATHGQLKVLGMAEPIPLKNIYTSARLIKNPSYYSPEYLNLNPNLRSDISTPFSIFKRNTHVKLLGGPGAGKSTLLRRITLQLLESTCSSKARISQIPILLELRKISAHNGSLTSALCEELDSKGFPCPNEFLKCGLERGKFILLLDGVDEIPCDIIRTVLNDIDALATRYPANRFIVTCRAALNWTTAPQFTDYLLLGFSNTQIQKFIKRWFLRNSNTFHTLSSSNQTEEKMNNAVSQVWNTISRQGNREVLQLARTPLMLTFICRIFEESYRLPENRALLCKGALEIMLSKWSADKRLKRPEIYAGLHLELELLMLATIARQMLEEDKNDYSKTEILDIIRSFLVRELGADRRLNAEEVFELIDVQQGMFVQTTFARYAFCYKAFRDYLVALHYKENSELEQLGEKWMSQTIWRGPILMAAGISRADHLIDGVTRQIAKWVQRSSTLTQFLQIIASAARKEDNVEQSFANRAHTFCFALNLLMLKRFSPRIEDTWLTRMQTAVKTMARNAKQLEYATWRDIKANEAHIDKINSTLPLPIAPEPIETSPECMVMDGQPGVDSQKSIFDLLDELEDKRHAKTREEFDQGEPLAGEASLMATFANSKHDQSPPRVEPTKRASAIIGTEDFRTTLQSLYDSKTRSRISLKHILQPLSDYVAWADQRSIFCGEIDLRPAYLASNSYHGDNHLSTLEISRLLETVSDQILDALTPELITLQLNEVELETYARAVELVIEIKSNALSMSNANWLAALQSVVMA